MKKLILVTGAGASKDFCSEFGVGKDLLDSIVDIISKDDSYLNNVIKHLITQEGSGIKKENLKYLREKGLLFQSMREGFSKDLSKYITGPKVKDDDHLSIDHFIDQKPKYKELASFCIAFFIAGYEGASFKNFNYNEHWLFRLCNILEYNYDNNVQVDIEVVTFNYDRLTEAYVHWYFSNRSKYCEKVKDFVRNKVHHVYGSIGRLPFIEDNDNDIKQGLIYGIHNSRSEFLQESTTKFQLMFHHSIQQDDGDTILGDRKDDESLKGILKSGNEVWFMGFGFDNSNVTKLGLDKGHPQYFTSAYNLADVKWNEKFIPKCNVLRASCSEFFNYRVENNTLGLPMLWDVHPWGKLE